MIVSMVINTYKLERSRTQRVTVWITDIFVNKHSVTSLLEAQAVKLTPSVISILCPEPRNSWSRIIIDLMKHLNFNSGLVQVDLGFGWVTFGGYRPPPGLPHPQTPRK